MWVDYVLATASVTTSLVALRALYITSKQAKAQQVESARQLELNNRQHELNAQAFSDQRESMQHQLAAMESQSEAQGRQAEVMVNQLALQLEAQRAAQQPYVWADIRVDDEQGDILLLVVGNSGPTVATDVHVDLDPPIRTENAGLSRAEEAHQALNRGLRSIAPGRQIVWSLGVRHQAWKEVQGLNTVITVSANGPHGSLMKLTYDVAFDDLGGTRATPPGNFRGVTRAVDRLTAALNTQLPQLRPPFSDEGDDSLGDA